MKKTAEFVTPKHPDKICDQISDAILDECLKQDPESRVAIETMGGHGTITITGELTTSARIDISKIVKEVYGEDIKLKTNIVTQSREIAKGVDIGGAGDQGVMIGYACNENEEMIPQELFLARKLCQYIYEKYNFDGKTQITIKDDKKIETIITSFCKIRFNELKNIVESWLKDYQKNDKCNILINPAGDWESGGFDADTGVTGRKIVIDAYGPRVPVGGGAFSGKDPSKVDRSAAYMARRIAVDILREKSAKEVYVYLAYGIGLKDPIMKSVFIDGREEEIKGYDLTPKGIINYLDLKKPIYLKTSKWGHFGRGFNWDI